jgi:hypothetical protein
MIRHGDARTGRAAIRYRIVVRGTTGRSLVSPAEGMRVESEREGAALVGDIVDSLSSEASSAGSATSASRS